MSRNFFAFIIILSCLSLISYGQNKKSAIVKGKLINSATKAPFSDVKVAIKSLNVFTTTDGEGNFELSEIPYGTITLTITAYNATTKTIDVVADKDVVELKDISVAPNDAGTAPESTQIPTIALEDNNNSSSEDDGVNMQSSGGIVIANRDPFISTMAFIFGLYRFQPRGYQRGTQEIQVNGIPVNDLETGYASWSSLAGGLSDVFHGRDVSYGLAPSPYTFGGMNGSAYVEATAADQRKGTDFTYTLTDRNYNNRVMFTENTGVMKNGWAFSFSGSRRWAQEGYVPGTSYDGYSYYASASKVIKKGILSLTTFGSPTYYTKAAAATKEADSIAGSNYYNHNWGLENGQVRNFATRNTYQPTTILNYEYRPSDKTRWNTAVAYQFGNDKNGEMFYDNAVNPLGDYYKKMPSYYATMVPPNYILAAAVRSRLLSTPNSLQLNWDNLYQSNYADTGFTIYNNKGVVVANPRQALAEYFLADKVNALKKFTFNTNIEHELSEHIKLSGGLTLISQRTETYDVITDLLGANYALDINTFASQLATANGANRNNLLEASPVVRVGDKFNYDYLVRYTNSLLWGQAVYTYNKFNFFAALNGGTSTFSRDGFMENATFPDNSYGKSAVSNFIEYAIKGGVSFTIDRNNFLFINASYSTTPPLSDNTFISPETRNDIINNPTNQNNKSLEGGYMLKSSNITARAVGYVTDVTNATQIKHFFNDANDTFVNYVLQGVNTRSIGTELALNYKFSQQWSILGVAAIGETFYTNDPTISVYNDEDTSHTTAKTYIKNYYVSAGPQTALTLGLTYRPKIVKYSYITLNVNYFDRNYVEINPDRRTTPAAAFYIVGSPQWHAVFDQEKLPAATTLDLRLGKNFQLSRKSDFINKISHNSILTVSAGVSNLLNNTNIINYGFEQLRYDFTNNNPAKFANKYIYGPGINFFLNVGLKF